MKKKIIFLVLLVLVVVGVYHTNKSLPDGLNYTGAMHLVQEEDVHFFADRTFVSDDERTSDQEIFDEVFRMIADAEEYILIDLFFFSDFIGVETEAYRYLSSELVDVLIEKKEQHPEIVIQVITDPINVMYGGHKSADFERLNAAGVPLVITELTPLRDSNPIYSALWRTFFQWFGNSDDPGYLPNPLDQKSQKLGLRTYLKMLNYKANHRKVVVADFSKEIKKGMAVLITSANPHDGSSAHSNIAVRVDAHLWRDAVASEAAVANISGYDFVLPQFEQYNYDETVGEEGLQTQLLTEEAIEDKVLALLSDTRSGDQVDIAMFYFADREVVKALKQATDRGVHIRLLLDPNKDAFGREKNGVPNRQIAHELASHSDGNLEVRWCNTHGEQCHSKLLLIRSTDEVQLLQGSANYTRRNLDNYNLETNVYLAGQAGSPVFSAAEQFFNEQWLNEGGIEHSVPYETYADTSKWRTVTYRIKEFTGLSRW